MEASVETNSILQSVRNRPCPACGTTYAERNKCSTERGPLAAPCYWRLLDMQDRQRATLESISSAYTGERDYPGVLARRALMDRD